MTEKRHKSDHDSELALSFTSTKIANTVEPAENSSASISPHRGTRITGIGSYVPDAVLTNAQLAQMVDTNDEWIVQRTGIRERRTCAPGEFTSDLCAAAIERMLNDYPVSIQDADLILVSTHTPDYPFPSVACQLQERFGITSAGAVDLNATCAGFVYALQLANGMISAGLHRKIIVVGADAMSYITDYTDRSTCILFGDGAGAVLLEHTEEVPAFLASCSGSDGGGGASVYRTGLRSDWKGEPLHASGKLVQNGREVYKWAVQTVPAGMKKLVEQAGLSLSDIDFFIPHSANLRMIESICEKSGYPAEKTLTSAAYYGNTSAASIPLALADAVSEGRVRQGDLLLLYGFGGGLTHAGVIVRWTL